MPQTYGKHIRTHTIDGQIKVGQAGVVEDMWQVGGRVSLLGVSDGPLSVVSSDANDTLTGTGARKVIIRGNVAGAEPRFQSVVVPMSGTSPVLTSSVAGALDFQASSIAQARVSDSNDLERIDLPTGTITISQGGNEVGKILALEMQTGHAFRRIPFGANGEIERWILSGGFLTVVDLAGKTDALIEIPLWTFSPGDQMHTDGRGAMQVATNSQSPLLFNESYDSGEAFMLRVKSDQIDVEFFANIFVKVYIEDLDPATGPVLTADTILWSP